MLTRIRVKLLMMIFLSVMGTVHVVASDGPRVVAPDGPRVVAPGGPRVVASGRPRVGTSDGPRVVAPDGPRVVAPGGPRVVAPDGPHVVAPDGPRVCVGIDDCKCQFDDGGIVDITSLGRDDNTPRFKDLPSKDGYLYSYNPCKPFTEFRCGKAAVCRKNRISGDTEMIGASEMAQFTYDELTGDTVIGYTAGVLANIHTFVYLMCDTSVKPGPPQMFPNGSLIVNQYVLMLYSVCACPGRCDAHGIIGDDTFPIAYVIIIVVVSAVLLYFIIGSVVMKYCKGATGVEVLPHSWFWCGITRHIKNCCIKCKHGGHKELK